MADEKKAWYDVYRELAESLLILARTSDDPGKKLYRLLQKDKSYLQDNQWVLKGRAIKSVDPIQLFSSLNSFGLEKELRLRRINRCRLLLLRKNILPIEDIDFTGCPSPIVMSILRFRKGQSQKEIWELFLNIMKGKKPPNDPFEMALRWEGISIPSLTIFLFWIDPSNYLPLDKYTTEFLTLNNKRFKVPPTYKDYQKLLSEKNSSVYRSIAKTSHGRGYDGLTEEEIQNIERFLGKTSFVLSDGFKIIGIRPLDRCNPAYLKVLKKDVYYSLCDAYTIKSSEQIEFTESYRPYQSAYYSIDISAVVGKNGTGKSSLIELFVAAINNIIHRKFTEGKLGMDEKPRWIDNINVDIFIKTTILFQLNLVGKKIKVFAYEQNSSIFKRTSPIDIKILNLDDLFYTIFINYSQHALNEHHYEEPWLHALFHKNDSYQVPVVLDPFREDGNIDVNDQEYFTKARLMANLLEKSEDSQSTSFRKLTDNQVATTLKLSLNRDKVLFVYTDGEDKRKLEDYQNYKDVLSDFLRQFEFTRRQQRSIMTKLGKNNLTDVTLRHIYKKLLTIARNYYDYHPFFDGEKGSLRDFSEYIRRLKGDDTHIAFKIKQSANYLRFSHLPKTTSFSVQLDPIAERIDQLKVRYKIKHTIQLIPPSFFDVDIILSTSGGRGNKATTFKKLSSGEKQQIFSVNSIVYHLRNIDSNHYSDRDAIKYKNIHIILEEIELYFHPEYQRNYIKRLISAINNVPLEYIRGINFCFITHSPFILSDIPSHSVLFLKMGENNKSAPMENKPATFGANIHDLLAGGFFMEDTMGAIAREKIKGIISFCHETVRAEPSELDDIRKMYVEKKKEFYFIQQNIGEEYIRSFIANHLAEIEKKLGTNEYINTRIQQLQKEIKDLQSSTNAQSNISL